MTIPVVIFGTIVISVVIVLCTLILLGFCLWPLIQECRKQKRLPKPPTHSGYVNLEQV